MAGCIDIRLGDTLSYAGKLSLPQGTWSAICSFTDNRPPFPGTDRYDIDVTLSLIGPDASDPTRNIWAIALTAPAPLTAQWPRLKPNEGFIEFSAAIRFSDTSIPPVTRTSESFTIRIKPQILP